jgi:hypothetical protein
LLAPEQEAPAGYARFLFAEENKKLRRVSPEISERDGMKQQPFESRKRKCASDKMSGPEFSAAEANGQGKPA